MSAASKGSSPSHRVRAKLVEIFGADLRSLAAFRVVLALLVLADLASRLTDLSAHYTDAGVLPRAVLLEEVSNRWSISLNLVNGDPVFQALLFGATAVAALGMLVGYRTRLATVVLWVLLLSIQFRNPLISGAGEPLLRMLLFWAMFLPLGAVWSVDGARRVPLTRTTPYLLSLGTVGLFMQIAFMYWFTALQKSGADWRTDGTALYYALSYDQVATSLGTYLLDFPGLLKVLTFSTFLLEAFGPFLLLFPLFTGLVRTGAVLAFMSLHFGIWLTMDIGIFPWISALSMVCFLPGWFWDGPVARLRRALPRRLADLAPYLRRSAARHVHAFYSHLKAGPAPAAGLMARDGGGHGPTSEARPNTRRRKASKDAAQLRDGPVVLTSSLAVNLLAGFFLAYVFLWNLTTVSSFAMPERLQPIGYSFGLAQSWSMFAPFPAREDGWFVMPGTLRNGQQVDLMPVTRDDFGMYAVSWEKPPRVSSVDKNEHWRKYLQSIRQGRYAGQRLYLGRYICREWNARHTGSERLETFDIVYMLEVTQPDNRQVAPQRAVLRNHRCL